MISNSQLDCQYLKETEKPVFDQFPQIKIRKYEELIENIKTQEPRSPKLNDHFYNLNEDRNFGYKWSSPQHDTFYQGLPDYIDFEQQNESSPNERDIDNQGMQFVLERESYDVQYPENFIKQTSQFTLVPQRHPMYWYTAYYPNYSLLNQQQFSEKQQIEEANHTTESEISKKYKSALQNLSVSQSKCQCKKSLCLKLYCECFTNNQVCSTLCGCVDCGNRMDNQIERDKAVQDALQRNLDAFINSEEPHTISPNDTISNIEKRKDIKLPHVKNLRKGCTCKKTACKKKYCECFGSGNKCLPTCKCLNCQNSELSRKKTKIL